MQRLIRKLTIVVLLAACAGSVGFAASPRLAAILPGSITRGAEGTLVFSGERLSGAEEILFYDTGFEVLSLEDSENSLSVRIRVAPDCRLGEHLAHVRTRSGVTEFRAFYVHALPQIDEQEPNNDPSIAQWIDINTAVTGLILDGDEDVFQFDAVAGEVIKVEVIAMRFGIEQFDAEVSIIDQTGKSLAVAVGHPFSIQDAILSVRIPKDGRYLVKIREMEGGGSDKSHYLLNIGTFPRPLAVFPPGGRRGETLSVRFLGDPEGEYQQTITLPDAPSRDFGLSGTRDELSAPTPIPFRISDHTNALENEPNNTIGTATQVELPEALCGIVSSPGDSDYYRFYARQGEQYDVECIARRVRSRLDPVMSIFDKNGKQLLENDDGVKVTENEDAETRAPDSYFRFKVPQNGEYLLRITDRMDRGGPAYTYRVEISPVEPWMLVRLPRVEDPNGQYGQYRQQIFVARGNRYACLVRARFRDFSGRLVLEMPELPPGVTMETMPIPAGTNAFPVVFHAAEDAPLSGGLLAMRGRHADADKNISGGFYNMADLFRAEKGNILLKKRIVDRVPLVVTDKIPFRLELVKPDVPLVRDGYLDLRVIVHREQGFEGAVLVKMPFMPPGVSTNAGRNIGPEETEAIFRLTAHPQITPRDWKIYAIGSTGDEKDLTWASTALVPLEIRKQHVLVELPHARGQQGGSITLPCLVNMITPFEGTAHAHLTGLPSGVTAQKVSFESGTREITFLLQADSDAPLGTHTALACEVQVPRDESMVVARAGKGRLHIEAPSDQQSENKSTNDGKDPVASVRSRLEQIRADATARRASGIHESESKESEPKGVAP